MPTGVKFLAVLLLCTFLLVVSGRTNVLRGSSSRELRRDTKTTLAGDKDSANANNMRVTIDKKKNLGAGAVAKPVDTAPAEKDPKEGKADIVEKDDEYDADMDDDDMVDGFDEGEEKDYDEGKDEGEEPASRKDNQTGKETSDPATTTAVEDGQEGKKGDAPVEGKKDTKVTADDKGEEKEEEEGNKEQGDATKHDKVGLLPKASTTKDGAAPVAETEIDTDTDKTTSGTVETKKDTNDGVKEVDGTAAATGAASGAVADGPPSKSGPPMTHDAEVDKDTKADATAADAAPAALADATGEPDEKDDVGEADVRPADSSSSSNDKKKTLAKEESTATAATDEGQKKSDSKAVEMEEGKAETGETKKDGEAAAPEKNEKGKEVDSTIVAKPTDDGKEPAAPELDDSNAPDPTIAEQEEQQQKQQQEQQEQQEQHQQQQQQQHQEEVKEVKEVKEEDVAPMISESGTAAGTVGTAAACNPLVTCNGHGKCDEDGSCRCYPPYTGSACLRDACLDIWDCNECVGSTWGCYFSDGECRGDGLMSPEESTCRPAWLASVMTYMQFALLFGVVLLVAGGMVWRSRRAGMVAGGREGGLGGFMRMPMAGGGPEGEGENWNWDPEEDSVELLKQSGKEGGREGGREGQGGGKGTGIYALIRPSSNSSPIELPPPQQQQQMGGGLGAGVTSRRDSEARNELQSGEDLFAELGMEAQPQFNLKMQNGAGSPGQHRSSTRSSRLSAAGTSPVKGGNMGGEGLAPGWMDDEDLDL